MGTCLLYFHCSHLHQTTLITEMGLCKENHFIFKNQYEFCDLVLTDLWKNLQQKNRQRPLWMTFERPTAAVSECGLVWQTTDSCQWGNWRMEMTYPGLCPWNGMPFWTFVAIMVAACPLLTFSCWMVERFACPCGRVGYATSRGASGPGFVPRTGWCLSASPAGDQPISSLAWYRIIPL